MESLVDFEIRFYEVNNAVLNSLSSTLDNNKVPKNWVKVTIDASAAGYLSLDPDEVQKIFQLIKNGSAILLIWHHYISEYVAKNKPIIEFKCDPEIAEYLKVSAKNAFTISKEELFSHKSIDKTLKTFESKLCHLIDEKRFIDAEETIRKFAKLREQYIEIKKKLPKAFYPGSRTLGSLTFGWTFLSRWDDVLENVFDYILKSKVPEGPLATIIYTPFRLAMFAIDNRQDSEAIQTELRVSFIVYRAIYNKAPERLQQFFSYIESTFEHLARFEHQIESEEDGDWYYEASKIFVKYALGYLRSTLKGETKLEVQSILNLISLITSVDLGDVRNTNKAQELHASLSLLRSEVDLAVLAYCWFASKSTKHSTADRYKS